MQNYNLLYCNYWMQILVVVLFPVLCITPVVLVLLTINTLSDVALITTIVVTMIAIIISLKYIVLKQLFALASITINKSGIQISPLKTTIFVRFPQKNIPFENIRVVTEDEDVSNDSRAFFMLKLKVPFQRIMLMAAPNSSLTEVQDFASELHNAIKSYNQSLNQLPKEQIKEGSFYAGPFAKFATCFCILLSAACTVMYLADNTLIAGYRLVWLYSITGIWCLNHAVALKRVSTKR